MTCCRVTPRRAAIFRSSRGICFQSEASSTAGICSSSAISRTDATPDSGASIKAEPPPSSRKFSIGAFDTHGGQSWQQQDNLQQVSQALDAFYAATVQLGVGNQVTAFTLSDFGRTLQPNATGTDHGWGNHHLIMGGAVNGGRMYGRFPLMTNYANANWGADDFSDNRGVMLPNTSLAQYGATLAQWFGAADSDLDSLFPTLPNFNPARNLGFV